VASAPKRVYIVSHTHWDREWYLTFNRFRVNLVEVVDRVLEALENDPDFAHFVLDGQTCALEDYLAVAPHEAERIAGLVRSGALAIGPWYILPDEFLVSAEATARNLLYGHAVARRFGEPQKVGYLPDSFGHLAQLPQILRLAGIDSFIYTRGSGNEIERLGWEYEWTAPDGSSVLAINQCDGYCNAAGLGFAEIWHAHTQRSVDLDLAVQKVSELFARMADLANGDIYLLNNGCDHFGPQADFGAVLDALRNAFPDTEFLHTRFEPYLDAVRDAGLAGKRHQGDLLAGKLHLILSGVWSARMYLKQQNEYVQNLLTAYVEPLCTYTHFLLGEPYRTGVIDHAWQKLLRNHPHDSICGCSTDQVHHEMETRFAAVRQTGEQLLTKLQRRLVPYFGRTAAEDRSTVLPVANPLPWRRTAVVERLVVLQPLDYDLENLRLFDEVGNEVAFEVADRRIVERFWGIDYRAELFADRQHELFRPYRERFADRILKSDAERGEHDCFLTIRFVAENLPAVGHTRYFLTDDGPPAALSLVGPGRPAQPATDNDPGAQPVRVAGDTIENGFCRVRLHPDGTFDLHDKRTGSRLHRLNRLEDSADVGDEYDYCPSKTPRSVYSDGCAGDVAVVVDTGLTASLEASFRLRLPRAIAPDRRTRSTDLVDCRVRTRITLSRFCPCVTVDTTFDNQARDHRLRVEFPTDLATDTLVTDGHYRIAHRCFTEQPASDDWLQPPPGTYPQQDFSLVQADGRGLAVLNRGLPEVAAARDAEGRATIVLTLLRCVDWLSRDDLHCCDRSNAGPTLFTPDAQCLGEQRFRYAVLPFGGDYIAANIKKISQSWRTPVLVGQGVADGSLAGASLVEKMSPAVAFSALKKHQTRDSLVLRLYNLTGEPVTETLRFGLPVAGAWRVDLLEERLDGATPDRIEDTRRLVCALGPHEIVTVEVALHH